MNDLNEKLKLISFMRLRIKPIKKSSEMKTGDGIDYLQFELPEDEDERFSILKKSYQIRNRHLTKDTEFIDMNCERRFRFNEAILVGVNGIKFVASPYFSESKGTFLDFMEVKEKKHDKS